MFVLVLMHSSYWIQICKYYIEIFVEFENKDNEIKRMWCLQIDTHEHEARELNIVHSLTQVLFY